MPSPEAAPEVRISQKTLSGLSLTRLEGSGTVFSRTQEQAERSGDDVVLCVARGADVTVRTRQGDATVFPEGSIHVWNANCVTWGAVDRTYKATLVTVPKIDLERTGIDLASITAAGGVAGLRPEALFLSHYADLLFDSYDGLSEPARRSSLGHLADFVVMALDAGGGSERRDSAVRAARLSALTRDIVEHLDHPDLSPGRLAYRHGISTRYLRSLFAGDQSSSTKFVLEQRLLQARRWLIAASTGGAASAKSPIAAGSAT